MSQSRFGPVLANRSASQANASHARRYGVRCDSGRGTGHLPWLFVYVVQDIVENLILLVHEVLDDVEVIPVVGQMKSARLSCFE